eukprot:Clim_evm56s148 gene=Clim_evmTU56s148
MVTFPSSLSARGNSLPRFDHINMIDDNEVVLKDVAIGTIIVLCGILGAGVLGVPYAFESVGGIGQDWVPYGIIGLAVVSGLQIYTSLLLSRAMKIVNDADGQVSTYADYGKFFLGPTMKVAILVSQMGTCIGYTLLFLVATGQNLENVVPLPVAYGRQIYSGAVAVVVAPFVLKKTMKENMVVSILGFAASAAVLVTVCVITAMDMDNDTEMGPRVEKEVGPDTSIWNVVQGLAMMVYAYAPHPLLPDVQRSVTHGSMPWIIFCSLGFTTVAFVIMGTLTGLSFGCVLRSNILLNLTGTVAGDVVSVAMALHLMAALVIYLIPIYHWLESDYLELAGESIQESTEETIREEDRPLLRDGHNMEGEEDKVDWSLERKRVAFRLTWLAGTALISLFFDDIGTLMGLIGGSTLITNTILCPAIIQMKIDYDSGAYFRKPSFLACALICFLCTLLGVAATSLEAFSIFTGHQEHSPCHM